MLNIYISLVLVEMSRLGLIEHRKSLNPFVFFKYRSLSSNEDDIFLPTYFCLFFGGSKDTQVDPRHYSS